VLHVTESLVEAEVFNTDAQQKVDDLATFEQNGVAKYLRQEKQASDALRQHAQASSANNDRPRRGQCSEQSVSVGLRKF